MFTLTMLSMNPVSPSAATCQRPGTSWRLMPSAMKPKMSASATSIQAALLVKLMSYGPMCSGTSGSTANWCIGSILPSAATGPRLPLLLARTGTGLGLGKPHDVPHADAEPEEQHQQEEQRESPVTEKRGQRVQTPSDHGPADGCADQMTEELLPKPVARVRLPPCGPFRFRLLQTVEPLVERFE